VVTGGRHVLFKKGVNTLLTCRASGSRKKGAQRLNNSSHEISSLERRWRSQTFYDFHISKFRKRRAWRFNLPTRELRVRLVLSPSQWLRVERSNMEEPYPIASWVLALGEEKVEGLQPMNTRVAKGACVGTRSWSYGSVRLALGVSFSRRVFTRTYGSDLLKVSAGSQRRRFSLRRI